VEVEIVTPQSVRAPENLIRSAIETAVIHQVDGTPVPVVDVRHLIALKLQRASRQDQADIESIVRSQRAVDLSGLSLTQAQTGVYDDIVKSLGEPNGHGAV
jgi:hypothetical protein